jgi:hypothetical protein
MCDELQDDIDQAAQHQQQQEERRRSEPNSGAMDPALFTTPMDWPVISWPRYDRARKVWKV